MNSNNLGHFPSEIIQEILEHLRPRYMGNFPHQLEYQLLNRHWYHASMKVVYKKIYLNESLDDYENYDKVESFLSLSRNPLYNFEQYMKEVWLESRNTIIWGALLKHCPNFEVIYHESDGPVETIWEYVLQAPETNGGEKLWKRMQHIYSPGDSNSFYRFCTYFVIA